MAGLQERRYKIAGPALTREEREFLLRPCPPEAAAAEEPAAGPGSAPAISSLGAVGSERLADLFRGLGALVMHRLMQKLV